MLGLGLGWGHIRCCGCCRWRFRFYSDSLFQTPKSKQKALPPAYGTSLRLSVPSLRCPSEGIASGLLRCTSSRCVRLRHKALRAYPLMNTFARPADGAKEQKQHQKPEPKPKPKQIKRSQPSAAPGKSAAPLLCCQTAFASKLAPTENQKPTARSSTTHHNER